MWEEVSCSGASLVATAALCLSSGIGWALDVYIETLSMTRDGEDAMTRVTICQANTSEVGCPGLCLSSRLAARLGEGTHSEVKKSQREYSRQKHFTQPRIADRVTMIFPDGSCATDERE